jgi:hypothetical protein
MFIYDVQWFEKYNELEGENGDGGCSQPILLDTDVRLKFSKNNNNPPPFIYSIFLKTIPIHIFPLKILTQSYIS